MALIVRICRSCRGRANNWRNRLSRWIDRRISRGVDRQAFNPKLLGMFVNPFFFARRGLYRHIKALSHQVTGVTLDVGCGSQPYRSLFNVPEYVGLELDTPANRRSKRADFFYEGETFPFSNQRFDTVVLFEVLEHVFNPDRFLAEIHRVLKPNGAVLITVPMVWDEHEQPFDFARYSSFGVAHLLQKHGFAITEHRKSVDDISVICQLLNTYLYKTLIRGRPIWDFSVVLVFMAPVNIVGAVLAKLLPRNPDLYLDNVVLARKTAT